MKPVCEVLSKQGLYVHTALLAKEATPSQPTLPRALYWIHTLHVFYNVPDRNGRAGE